MGKKLALFIIGTVAISILCEIALLKNALARLENRSWDMRAELVAAGYVADPAIKLVVLDQESLDYFELQGIGWPLPRGVYAKILGFFKGVDVKGVAFDLPLFGPSKHGPGDDAELAAAMAGGAPVVIGARLSGQAGASDQFREKQSLLSEGLFVEKLLSTRKAPVFEAVSLPAAEIVASSAGLGILDIAPDPDGVSRRYLALAKAADVPVLSLAFSLFNAGSVVRNVTDLTEWVDRDGKLTMHFSKPGAFRSYGLARIYRSLSALAWGSRPEVDPKEFAGSWVFVGVTAPGLSESRVTPVSAWTPDLEYHAAALDNLLNGAFAKRLSPLYDNLFASAFIALAMLIAIFVPSAFLQIVMFALLFSGFVGGALLFAHNGLRVSMVAPLIAIAGAMIVGLAGALSIERGRRRRAEEGGR